VGFWWRPPLIRGEAGYKINLRFLASWLSFGVKPMTTASPWHTER